VDELRRLVGEHGSRRALEMSMDEIHGPRIPTGANYLPLDQAGRLGPWTEAATFADHPLGIYKIHEIIAVHTLRGASC
jgi:hypothetical protein